MKNRRDELSRVNLKNNLKYNILEIFYDFRSFRIFHLWNTRYNWFLNESTFVQPQETRSSRLEKPQRNAGKLLRYDGNWGSRRVCVTSLVCSQGELLCGDLRNELREREELHQELSPCRHAAHAASGLNYFHRRKWSFATVIGNLCRFTRLSSSNQRVSPWWSEFYFAKHCFLIFT